MRSEHRRKARKSSWSSTPYQARRQRTVTGNETLENIRQNALPSCESSDREKGFPLLPTPYSLLPAFSLSLANARAECVARSHLGGCAAGRAAGEFGDI